jgi:hypothetical protein
MPILTRQANIVTSPFGGGNPVVNPVLTGHDSSNVSVGMAGQTDTKSVKWHNFLGVPGKINSALWELPEMPQDVVVLERG